MTTPAAKCTLKVTSNKVLLKARKGKPKKGAPVLKPGTLSLTVKCGQAGKVKLTGTLTQLIGVKPKHGKQKSKTYKLGPVIGSVTAGHVLTLTVKLSAGRGDRARQRGQGVRDVHRHRYERARDRPGHGQGRDAEGN